MLGNNLLTESRQLLALVPRPVKAVILVSPYTEGIPRWRAENEAAEKQGGSKVDGSVFWMKQTARGYPCPDLCFANRDG